MLIIVSWTAVISDPEIAALFMGSLDSCSSLSMNSGCIYGWFGQLFVHLPKISKWLLFTNFRDSLLDTLQPILLLAVELS